MSLYKVGSQMNNEGIFMSKNEQFEYRTIYDFILGKLKDQKQHS